MSKNQFQPLIFILFSLLFFSQQGFAVAFSEDSLGNKKLKEVTVNGQHLQLVRAAMPVQAFSEQEIGKLNASSVSDIAKHFAGVTVKDYGGIGGMKTVSLRGLGALHTGVSYDGVMMSDIQTGQIDLGRFSIENISSVSLTNGQPNDIFQPARMFASSGVLCFSTKMPEYDPTHTLSGKLSSKSGSFGMYNPSLYLCKNLNKKWAVSLSSDGLMADGEYKYLSNLNSQGSNFVEKTRKNSDVQSIRSEFNTVFRMKDFESITFKANHFYSDRGLPGPDILYSEFSTERMIDKNYIAQIHYENKQSCYFQYQVSSKFNNSYSLFTEVNPIYNRYPGNKLISNFNQNEYYFTSAVQFFPVNSLSISSSIDWFYNDLFSHSNQRFSKDAAPTRQTLLLNTAAKYSSDRLIIGSNILYTQTCETSQTGSPAPNRNKFSPTLSLSYKVLDNKDFRLRSFYKNIFRLPTFSDLYYHDFGFVNLRPEITNQYNIGVIYNELEIPHISELEMSVDGYYNSITDKIIIKPGIPFSSIRNVGSVEIKGCDVNFKISAPITPKSILHIHGNYTFQIAQDLTPNSPNYLEQIPYTPFHSGSGSISYQYDCFEGGYNLLYSGKRWIGQITNPQNLLEPYSEQSLYGNVNIKKIKLTGEIINLFDYQYQVIKNYPMPGRNYRVSVTFKL